MKSLSGVKDAVRICQVSLASRQCVFKQNSPYAFPKRLISLSGDVEQNPGPETEDTQRILDAISRSDAKRATEIGELKCKVISMKT